MTESVASDQRLLFVLLVPPPFGNEFQMFAAGIGGAPCQSRHGKIRKPYSGFPPTLPAWTL